MPTLDQLGVEDFTEYPTGWFTGYNDPSKSDHITLSGGSEGLTAHTTTADTYVFTNKVTSFGYDAAGCSMIVHFPLNQGVNQYIDATLNPGGGGSRWGFAFDARNGVIKAMGGGSVYANYPVSQLDRYFRIDFLPTNVKWHYSRDNTNWTQFATVDGTFNWNGCALQILNQPFTDNTTAGITTIEGKTTQSLQPGTGLTLQQAQDLFTQWLDTTQYTQPHSAPILTYQTVVPMATQLDGLNTYLRSVLGAQSEWTSEDYHDLATFLAALLANLVNLIALTNTMKDILKPPTSTSDVFAEITAHRAATEPFDETLPDFITRNFQGLTTILGFGDGTGSEPVLVDEMDWTGVAVFNAVADFYIIQIFEVDNNDPGNDLGITREWTGVGFCMPLTPDGYPEYGPRLATGVQVVRTKGRMSGILLSGRRVLSGHVKAYQYQLPTP